MTGSRHRTGTRHQAPGTTCQSIRYIQCSRRAPRYTSIHRWLVISQSDWHSFACCQWQRDYVNAAWTSPRLTTRRVYLAGDKLQLQRSYKIHSARVKVSRVDYFLLIVQSNVIKRGASGANQRQLRPTTSLQQQQQQQQGEKHKQNSWRFIAFICTIYSYNILLIFEFASRVGHTWGRTRPHIIII